MIEVGKISISVEETQRQLLEKHLSLVIKANKITNITRIDSVESAQILHIEDSIAGLQELLDAPEGLYGDLGAGAGYPGIPMAICSGRQAVLVESVKKKASILESIISELSLQERIKVYPGRAEELALEESQKFSVLSARALSKIGSLLELASPLLKNKGRMICFKAHIEDEELDHALAICDSLGFRLISDRDFYLSDNETYRRIVVFEKYKKAKIKLPRRNGMAQKNPL